MLKKDTIHNVLSLALPAVGEMVLYMMIWVFDTMMVGKYGGNIAVSTVGLSSEIMSTFTGIFISVGISVGVTSLVARSIGAKNINKAEEYAALGLLIGGITALFIALSAFLLCDEILRIAGAKGEVITFGVLFMRITSFGIFFNMLANILSAVLRGYGNTRTPLLVSIIVNLVNIGLDWLLIFGNLHFPELGIKGSAIATASAKIIGFIFLLTYTIKKSRIKIKFKYIANLRIVKIKEILKLSIPSSLQEASFSISRLLSTFFIMHLGTIAFASNQITTTIEGISFMPGWGFSVAATTLVGHKIGEENYEGAREYAYTCTILGVIIMSLCSILFLTIPNILIKAFISTSEIEVIKTGSICLMIASIEQPFMALSMIFGGALKGAGDTKTPFTVSLISSWLIRLPLMYYFIYIVKISVIYVWWITTLQWFIDGMLLMILFKKRFKTSNLINKT